MEPLTVHHSREPFPDTRVPDIHQDVFSKNVLGFWMYLMTDCILFAVFFTTYAVLRENFSFHLGIAFTETMLLLVSSFTSGMALLASLKNQKSQVLSWLGITFLLGAAFIGFELTEFSQLMREGNGWTRNAFFSSFFALVGLHGMHVSTGLLWIVVMFFQVGILGITSTTFRRLVIFNMFWHFLDLIWIFIFTFVYLMGAI